MVNESLNRSVHQLKVCDVFFFIRLNDTSNTCSMIQVTHGEKLVPLSNQGSIDLRHQCARPDESTYSYAACLSSYAQGPNLRLDIPRTPSIWSLRNRRLLKLSCMTKRVVRKPPLLVTHRLNGFENSVPKGTR